jgi:hypothetical protein
MRVLPISSLGLITSTATAARITAADASFSALDRVPDCTVIGFQWVSGTINIGGASVAAAGTDSYCILDTTTRVREFRCNSNTQTLPIKDFWCVGTGTFICYYQNQ